MSEDDLTLSEVWRSLQGLKTDLYQTRQDTQQAIGKVESAVDNVREAINSAPYVHQNTYEERSKANGERVGTLEKQVYELRTTLTAVNQKAWALVLTVLTTLIAAGLIYAFGL